MDNDADDRAFFQGEIERLMDCLYGTALRLTRDPADAEDLVSEAVVRAWGSFGQLRDRKSFPKWILRILTNTFVSDCRRRSPGRLDAGEFDSDDGPFSMFDKLHQPFLLWWGNPEQELVDKLLRKDIERALNSLPDAFRTVVVLVEIQEYCYAEVAAMLGIPIGTVRSRLSRARSLLQHELWQQALEVGLLTETRKREHADE
jgi:RNA polymerase sigma-70 factor (ECF subfamily)